MSYCDEDGELDEDCLIFEDPWVVLRFLSGRFKYAGVSEGVAEAYARDIDLLLKKFNQEE